METGYVVNVGKERYILQAKSKEQAIIRAVNLYVWDTKTKIPIEKLRKNAKCRIAA